MKSLVVVSYPAKASVVIRWAARFASIRGDSLTILCCEFGSTEKPPATLPEESGPNEPELIRNAREAAGEITEIQVEILTMCHPRPSQAIADHIEDLEELGFLVVGADYELEREAPGNLMARYLLHFAPCDTLLLDPGDRDGTRCQQILVPMGMRLESFALVTAIDFAKKWGSKIVPLEIGNYFGSDSQQVAERAIANRLKDSGIEPSSVIQPMISLSGKKWKTIVQKDQESDLVLVGATADRALTRLRQAETQAGDYRGNRGSIGLLRPEKLDIKKPWARIGSLLTGWLPNLGAGGRIDLFDRLHMGARWNVDFTLMIGLSTAIASLGLIQDSVAVVIGAMVVAPLMTPLIGAGMSLVQGNTLFFRDSLRAMAYGIAAALVISMVIGLITPLEGLTPQILARGAPTLLDMGVAMLSGIAAAYAMARPSLLGALAGVAIAAALVPPLASVGIAITHADWGIAKGAAILFLTNLVAIILGAAWIFGRLGIQGSRHGIGLPLWVRKTFLLLILCSVILIAPLGFSFSKQFREGQTRPYMLPVSRMVYEVIVSRVHQEQGVTFVSASRFGMASDIDVAILLSAEKPVSVDFISDLKKVVKGAMGKRVRVEVYVFKGLGVANSQ